MLSNTCKYAIRAVIYLAVKSESGSKVGIKTISKELDLPSPFLGKILQTLAKHKILASTKGPNGGFSLRMDPEELHLLDIVVLVDGMDSFNKCGIGVKDCMEQEKPCAIHSRYAKMRDEMKILFESTTLAQLVTEVNQKGSSILI